MMDRYIPYDDVIYRLRGYVIADLEEAVYPEFEGCLQEEVLFHTLQEAEAKVGELAMVRAKDRYCFFIHEIPVGVQCTSTYAQSIRSYTSDGKLFARSAASSIEDKNGQLEIFLGRDDSECPLHPGDLVEVFHGDYVSLEVIHSLPCSRERASEILNKQRASGGLVYHLDYTDDGYTTRPIDVESIEESHSHPAIVRCFPAMSKVRDTSKALIEENHE